MGQVKLTWYKRDLETISKALEVYKRSIEPNDQVASSNQELVRACDMREHIQWVLNREVQSVIQVQL